MARGHRVVRAGLAGRDLSSDRAAPGTALAARAGWLRLSTEVAHDPDFDEETRLAIAELAEDETFLLAVEEYVGRTRVIH